MRIKDSESPKLKNLNPLFITDDPEKNKIFWKGMYSINQLNSIMALVMSGRLSPHIYKSRYAPRVFTYKKYIYDFLAMIDRTRNMDLVYIQLDAKQTLRDFDECVQNYISTENQFDKFLSK